MRSISACFAGFGGAVLLAMACSGSAGDLFAPAGGSSGATGFGGRGGRGGSANPGGGEAGGGLGEAGADGGVDDDGGGIGGDSGDGGDGGGDACSDGCDDGNDCTVDSCDADECSNAPAAAGALCGSERSDECTQPDGCDGQGECLSNHAVDGSQCSDGSCTLGECVEGQPVGCPALVVNGLPFATGWRSVGRVDLYAGDCDVEDTPDFALVFTAPATGVYRIEASGEVGADDPELGGGAAAELADSVLTIAAGACAGFEAPLIDCSDDIADGNLDSRVELLLEADETITIYANEFGEVVPGGGSGTLSVTQL